MAKPSLKFVLRLLTGLAHSHETTQTALAQDSIPLFHHLEQISSDEHVGSLAENLLEAMRGHPQVKKKKDPKDGGSWNTNRSKCW